MVRAIVNRMASVYLYDDGQEVDVPCRYVEPTPPNKYDKVRISALLNLPLPFVSNVALSLYNCSMY